MWAGRKEGRQSCLKFEHFAQVNLAPFLLLAACQTFEMNFAACTQEED